MKVFLYSTLLYVPFIDVPYFSINVSHHNYLGCGFGDVIRMRNLVTHYFVEDVLWGPNKN
jgi:hypothetical protein